MARPLQDDLLPLETDVATLKIQEGITKQVKWDLQWALKNVENDLKALSDSASKCGAAEKQVEVHAAKVKRLDSKITALRASRDQLKTAETEASGRKSDCKKKYNEKTAALENQQRKVSKLESDFRTRKSAKQEAEKAVADIKATAPKSLVALNALEQSLKEKSQALDVKQEELKVATTARDSTSGEVKTLKAKMDEAYADVIRQSQKKEDEQKRLMDKKEKLTATKLELEASKKICSKIKAESQNSSSTATTHLKAMISKATKENEAATKDRRLKEQTLKTKKEVLKKIRQKAADALAGNRKRRLTFEGLVVDMAACQPTIEASLKGKQQLEREQKVAQANKLNVVHKGLQALLKEWPAT